MDSSLSANNATLPAGSQRQDQTDRRSALAAGSSLLMAAGLVGGYGTFFTLAGRYLFPSGAGRAWMFVADAKGVKAGQSLDFESPAGVRVTITRKADSTEESPTAESFLALSSVCPHLGCRVHWEGHNDRFFCPCHNGVFDPSGKAVSGPPAADGQDLPRYPLQVVDGALYIEMPYSSV
jgi:Rieske Fe-S protein